MNEVVKLNREYNFVWGQVELTKKVLEVMKRETFLVATSPRPLPSTSPTATGWQWWRWRAQSFAWCTCSREEGVGLWME